MSLLNWAPAADTAALGLLHCTVQYTFADVCGSHVRIRQPSSFFSCPIPIMLSMSKRRILSVSGIVFESAIIPSFQDGIIVIFNNAGKQEET